MVNAEELKIGAGGAPTENILKPIRDSFEKSTGIKLYINSTGPKNALIDLGNGDVEAAAAGLAYQDWLALMKKEGQEVKDPTSFNPIVIGKDRIMVIVHKDNPVKKLSAEQLKEIFTGQIISWKDVGGEDLPIMIVVGKLTPGTNAMFSKKFLDGKDLTKEVLDATNAEDVRQNVMSNPSAIGFGPVALVDSSVRTPETPELSRDITLLTKGKPSARIQKLIDYINGAGRKYIKE
jgi:phosphate transport system substrate-binding protein